MSELSRELEDYYARYGSHLRPYLLSKEPGAHQTRCKPRIDTRKIDSLKIPSTSKYGLDKIPSTSKYGLDKISPKSRDSSSGRFSENAEDDHVDCSLNKDYSPESSFASRRLEWDSLADIGYNNSENTPALANKSLSTLERIALERHCKIAFSLDSTKNKATIGIKTKNSLSVGKPNAQSTPIEINIKTKPKVSILKSNVSDSDSKGVENPNPESERLTSNEPIIDDMNINNDEVQSLNKEIQTSLINNICTSSQTSQRLMEEPSNIPNILTKGSIIFNVVKSNKSPMKRKQSRIVKIYTRTKPVEKTDSNEEQFKSSDNSSIQSSNKSDNNSKCEDDILSKVDSFEFVPGYMFNKSSADSDANEVAHSYVESSLVPSGSISNPISINSDKEFSPKFGITNSFSNDLLTNINKTNELIDARPGDADFKTAIITKMVNAMVSADYESNNSDKNTGSDVKTTPVTEENIILKINPPEKFKFKSSIALINELVNSRHKDPIVKERIIKKMVKLLVDTDDSDGESSSKVNTGLENKPKTMTDEYCQTETHRSICSEDKFKRNIPMIESKDIKIDSITSNRKNDNEIKSSVSSLSRDRTISSLKSASNNSLIKLLSNETLGTQRKLDIINDELVNLYKMKLNLENKRLDGNVESETVHSNEKNVPTSADLLVKTKTMQNPSENIYIPLLNFESSPEESQLKSYPIEMSLRSSKRTTASREKLSEKASGSTKSNTNRLLDKNTQSSFENSLKSSTKISSSVDITSESKSSKSCKCSMRSSNLCQYCSQTNSLNSNSRDANDTSDEVQKLHRAYSKYQKCKTMKSFMKEYDSLVTKYKNMKSLLSLKQQHFEQQGDSRSIDSKSAKISASRSKNSNYPVVTNVPIDNISLQSSMNPLIASNSSKSISYNSIKDPISQSKSLPDGFQTSQSSKNKSALDEHPLIKEMANTMMQIKDYLSSMDIKNDKSRSIIKEAKCTCKIKSDRNTSSHREYVQPQQTYRKCKCVPTKPCKSCLKQSLQSQKNQLDTFRSKKPIAYDLILQPSDSVLEESHRSANRKPLTQVIVKVPNKCVKKNDDRALRNPSIVISPCVDPDDDGSTDDQLKEFSSLNDDYSPADNPQSDPINGVPANDNAKTLNDYLMENRPRFVHRADERRFMIKQFKQLRNLQGETRRRLITSGLANIPNLKDISLSDIQNAFQLQPVIQNNRLFDSREIVKNTNRQCKNLSEVVMRKETQKKNEYKKTNRFMAEIFKKQLRRKALRGVVNFPHHSKIVSL